MSDTEFEKAKEAWEYLRLSKAITLTPFYQRQFASQQTLDVYFGRNTESNKGKHNG